MALGNSTLRRVAYLAVVYALIAHFEPRAAAHDRSHWAATWTASPQAILEAQGGLDPGVPGTLTDQTVRQILHVSVGGHALRIELSNAYGTAPLHIGEARIARTASGASIVQGSDRPLTFGGETQVTIPPGAPAISDPVELDIAALSDLTVSIYIPETTPTATFHWTGQQTGYLTSGNCTSTVSLNAGSTFTARLFVSAVLVANVAARSVAAFGDSITDGSSSSLDRNQRWPDLLAKRTAPHRVGVVNAGISGNQLLLDGMGDSGIARFERDVLSQPGVEAAIVLLGINDIGGLQADASPPTANELIAGYRQLIAQAHSRGVRVLAGTLTPFEGALEGLADGYYTPEKERVRSSVNAWIRSSGEFDAVVDFDEALRDPEHPARIDAAYDSGDGLHPNDAGYQAMADAVNLHELLSRR